MAKKMGLGRGLSAILPDVEEVVESVDQVSETPAPVPADAVVELSVGDIDPNRNQPRKKFDDDALLALADSIRHNGVLSPILVARDGRRYTIIAGERRWRAARLANCPTIPAIVRDWDDVRRQEAALVENIQREDLNAIEEARGIRRLMEECALTQEVVAERIGRSRSAVANILRLLNLPERIQNAVIEGTLSAGHARVLAGIDDAELQSASKQLIHLDDYETMSLVARCSYVTRDDNGNLLNFFDWEKSGWMMGIDVDLTGDYHTVVQPLDHPENYVCIFFMKDSQGNTSYSEMIPLK